MNASEAITSVQHHFAITTAAGLVNSAQVVNTLCWGWLSHRFFREAPLGALVSAHLQIVAPNFYILQIAFPEERLNLWVSVATIFLLNVMLFSIGLMLTDSDPRLSPRFAFFVLILWSCLGGFYFVCDGLLTSGEEDVSGTMADLTAVYAVLEPCVSAVSVVFFIVLQLWRSLKFATGYDFFNIYGYRLWIINLGFLGVILFEKIAVSAYEHSGWSAAVAHGAHLLRVVFTQVSFGWLGGLRKQLPTISGVAVP